VGSRSRGALRAHPVLHPVRDLVAVLYHGGSRSQGVRKAPMGYQDFCLAVRMHVQLQSRVVQPRSSEAFRWRAGLQPASDNFKQTLAGCKVAPLRLLNHNQPCWRMLVIIPASLYNITINIHAILMKQEPLCRVFCELHHICIHTWGASH
jgi:hypothetical protein